MTDTLRSLLAAATPPPWKVEYQTGVADDEDGNEVESAWLSGPRMLDMGDYETLREADADLIVWLANHAEALADVVEAATDALAVWALVKAIEYRGDDQRALADPMIAIRETLAKLESTR